MAKLKCATYKRGYFCEGKYINFNLLMCKNNIAIMSKLQRYIVIWYNSYILHYVLDKMEAVIFKKLYWPRLIKAIQGDVIICDTFQRTKQ